MFSIISSLQNVGYHVNLSLGHSRLQSPLKPLRWSHRFAFSKEDGGTG